MSDSISSISLDWMPKSVWGPIKWKEIHWRAKVDLPMDNEKEWFGTFMASLPCEECRGHFAEFVLSNPPELSTREKFFEWTVCAHNHVNREAGKAVLTMEEAKAAHNEMPDPKQQ